MIPNLKSVFSLSLDNSIKFKQVTFGKYDGENLYLTATSTSNKVSS